MPRVFSLMARKSKHKRVCNKCGKPIKPGQRYLKWTFHRSLPTLRHEECGHPRPSELTRSKVSGLYAARESAEDAISSWEGEETGDVAQVLRDCAEEAENVKQEYEDSISNMPEQLQESSQVAEDMRERMESIESWTGELDSAASEIEGMELEEPDQADVEKDVANEMLQEAGDKGTVLPQGDKVDPIEVVRKHLDFQVFEQRVEEAMEEAREEKREEFAEQVREAAQTALDALEL